MPLRRPIPLLILAFLSACGFDRPVTSTEALPVIQGALIAGADSQFFRLDWALDPDSGWDGHPRPIAASDVALTISGTNGSQPLVFRPDLYSPAFVVTLPIYGDSLYTLSGTVAGLPISATTRVPHQLVVLTPSSDTVHIAADACIGLCEIDLLLLPTSRALVLNSLTSAGTVFSTDVLEVPYRTGLVANSPSVTGIEIIALGSELAAYQLGDTPVSNIEGAFGVFGGATRVRKTVVWE